MFIVYALYSSKYDKIYVGYTSNLEERMLRHNKLNQSGYTTRFRPWEVVYTESQPTKDEALRRERQLKSSRGRAFIWHIVRNQYPL